MGIDMLYTGVKKNTTRGHDTLLAAHEQARHSWLWCEVDGCADMRL